MADPARSTGSINAAAPVLAWLWPGGGHILLGQRRRGRLIMAGVLGLFIAGVLIGGVDCVDRREDRLWFLAQALNGPIAFAADAANQWLLKTGRVGEILAPAQPDRATGEMLDPASSLKGFPKVNEMGTLFTALAGLMNLAVILDTLRRPTAAEPSTSAAPRERRRQATPESAEGPAT